ncbi:ectonucleotide pyrophosphatase/phosphodiesterase [Qipengyuania marisflavi]|uniref:Alkaline phosphatase family protein n=1 Tax=Qipengyuania marisflavi TaxID=2486356 RepID=A0A5S3P954_9SPHN|nr:ectonucleotide pyrophosphatase/phosphodiesterase [Qipengyuania marisflavi]TMM49853.1 alkaline phosphatase family protein [Qipengyuania marisflavi]
MRGMVKLLAPVALALLSACAPQVVSTPTTPVAVQEQRAPVTILVSIDGFRPDYLARGITPALSGLAADGVSARLIPSFPTKTFPNHWTIVTGQYPDHHGIVANSFVDPARTDEKFTMANTDPFYWNAAEPIWVTAEKAGIRSAAMFWPGSAVGWGGTLVPYGYGAVDGGTYPQDWQAFSQQVTNTQRVNSVIDWLRRPADIRPQFVTLYFDTVDSAGHASAQDSSELNTVIASIDRDIATLRDGLAALGQPANLIILSDHGMAETSSERTVQLGDIVDPDDYVLVEAGPYASFNPVPGREQALEAGLLRPHDHMQCWRKQDIPARLHYGSNPRIPAYLCVAETGWQISDRPSSREFVGGNHGYDNLAPEMAALFIANGPAFKSGAQIAPFENIAVNPLLRQIMGLPQDSRIDGKLAPVTGALVQP